MTQVNTANVKEIGSYGGTDFLDGGSPMYDPEDEESGGSVPAAIFNLSKTVIGAGIFTMPSAFNDGGFFFSLIMILLMSYVVCWTMQLLVKTGVSQNILDYRALMEDAMGRWGSILYFLSGFVFAYGICIAYSIVTADTVPAIVHVASGIDSKDIAAKASSALKVFMDRRVMVTIVSILVLYPVSSLKFVKHMAFTSFVGLFMFAWAALSAMILCWTDLPKELHGTEDILTGIKPSGIAGVLSRVAFAAVTHHGQFVIYKSIRKTNLKKYNLVAYVSIALSAVSSVIFGIVCFVQLGEKAKGGNVLNYLPESNTWVQLGKAAFAIDVILTYPIELFISRDLIVKAIHGQNKAISTKARLLYSAVLVLGTLVMSVIFCDLNSVVDFTGGVAASVVAFVLPVSAFYIYERRKGEPINHLKFIPHLLVFLFGLAMIVLTFVLTIPSFTIKTSECSYKIL